MLYKPSDLIKTRKRQYIDIDHVHLHLSQGYNVHTIAVPYLLERDYGDTTPNANHCLDTHSSSVSPVFGHSHNARRRTMIVSRAHTHSHMPNNDQGQPLNAVWRYTLSSTSTPTWYYCADQGFEKAPALILL